MKFNLYLLCIITSLCFLSKDTYCAMKDYSNYGWELPQMPFVGNYIDLSRFGSTSHKSMSDQSRRTQSAPLYLTGFDNQIDEDEYILGTGDGFTIYLWGSINDEMRSIVDQEGNAIIPSVGMIKLKNLTLREGKKKIRKKILTLYKDIEMSIVLSEIRQFRVYVLGEVFNPGFYIVNGATRVSDVLSVAGYLYDDSTKYLRKVEIENVYHPVRYADMALFYHSNIISKNSYLLEGDRVFVSKKKEILSILGAVNYPGNYDLMSDDTLITIIKAAGGLQRGADSSKIIVTRFVDNKDLLKNITLSYLDSSVYTFQVQKDDRIFVGSISDYRKHRQVTVSGEVKHPGTYPIQRSKTFLTDIIKKAGGFTEEAFFKESKVKREEKYKKRDKELDILKAEELSNLSPLEKNYLLTKLEGNGNERTLSVDFVELFQNNNTNYDVILRDGDKIEIARKKLTIQVIGAVISPGLVTYKENAGCEYYIKYVGGVTDRARKYSIRVIKAGTRGWLRKKHVNKLEPGDVVWVPERPYRDGYQVVMDVLRTFGSVATVILTTLTIHDKLKKP